MNDIGAQLAEAFQNLIASIVAWTPRVVVGVVLVVIAIILAKMFEAVLRSLLRRLGFDTMLEKLGIQKSLERIGIQRPLSTLAPRVIYYLLLILFARTAADTLGLEAISSAIGSFMAYLPNVAAAALILLLGSTAAQLTGRAVTQAATNSGIEFAGSLGGMVAGVVLAVVGIMALGQLQVETEVVRIVVSGLLATMVLAFGLSFGLGSKEITRNIIAGFYARKTFEIGEELEIAGHRGSLTAITPTQTLLERDGQIIAVANVSHLDGVVKQG